MVCLYPLRAYRLEDGSVKVCSQSEVMNGVPLSLPCGRCKGCRLERSRQWAVRCMHEASLYDANSFVTLTYSPEHVPGGMSLDRKAFPLFMRRLRREEGWEKVRYYHCGEYGDRFKRPHYHALLFGVDFRSDRVERGVSDGSALWRSRTLDRLWPDGEAWIGSVTFESAAYVARYIMKKITGDAASDHYLSVDEETGEVWKREPEYATMSRRPGIGLRWLEKFSGDVYSSGQRGVVVRGKVGKPPRYYDKKVREWDPQLADEVSYEREVVMADREIPPLDVQEKILESRLSLFARELE